MSKQFMVVSEGVRNEVEAAFFRSNGDGDLCFYDKDDTVIHQFHSWTSVRTATPVPAAQPAPANESACETAFDLAMKALRELHSLQGLHLPQAPANESEAYRKGWENRMLRESPEFRDRIRGWDDAEQAAKAARESKGVSIE